MPQELAPTNGGRGSDTLDAGATYHLLSEGVCII